MARVWLQHSDYSSVCEFKAQQHALPKFARVLFLYAVQRRLRNFECRIILGLGKICYDVLKSPVLIPTLKQVETFHTLKIHSFKH
jgi:hypothetical protein